MFTENPLYTKTKEVNMHEGKHMKINLSAGSMQLSFVQFSAHILHYTLDSSKFTHNNKPINKYLKKLKEIRTHNHIC